MRAFHRSGIEAAILLSALCAGCGDDLGTGAAGLAPAGAGGAFAGQMADPMAGQMAAGTAGVSPLAGAGGTGAAGIGAAGVMAEAGQAAGGVGGEAGVSGAGEGGAAGVSSAGEGGAAGVSGAGEGGAAGVSGAGEGGAAGVSGAGEGGMAGMGATDPPKKFCGNITTGGRVRTDFIQYWDQITPENEGKWGSVERVRNEMNWSGLDAAYAYAKQHNIPFKQHTFVWGSQQPEWIAGLSQAQQRAEVEEWIRLYCERYPDTEMIDVVNEPPPHTTPVYAAALGGAGRSGFDWIVQSFIWARQYCPNSILILNDYNTIEYGNDNRNFLDIVDRIVAAGAPVDALGAQAHAAFSIPTATVKMYLDRLAATGLPVYISEYDINLASDAEQRRVMQEQFTMFWNHDAVPGITLWGYVRGQTWLANTGIISNTGEPRPAMTWLMDFLER